MHGSWNNNAIWPSEKHRPLHFLLFKLTLLDFSRYRWGNHTYAQVFQTWAVFSGSGLEKRSRCHASDYLLWNLACVCLHSWNCFCKSCASENGRNELLSQECCFAQHSDTLPGKAAFVFQGCRLTQIRIFSMPSNTSHSLKYLSYENTTCFA